MRNFIQDLRYAIRMLAKRPGFTLIAALTLALGIGANTAIFSAVNAVLLRPLPFPESGQLIDLAETFKPNGFGSVSVPNLEDWNSQNTVFAGIAAYQGTSFNLEGGEAPQRIAGLNVGANYFDVLGMKPALGRGFLPGEDLAGRERVVVLSDQLWRRNFGADPSIVNQTIALNGQKYTVVGVMPPELASLYRNVAVSVLTSVIFGLIPSLQAGKTDVQATLKEGGNTVSAGVVGGWLRPSLVVVEVAAAVVLLIGAGLMIRSVMRIREVEPGLRPQNLLTAKITLPREKYTDSESAIRFYQQVLERVSHLPGVESAGLVSHLPVEEMGYNANVAVEGKTYPPNESPLVEFRVVSNEYFQTAGIPLLRGRIFDKQEGDDKQPVVVINEAMAKQIWPVEDPIGKRLKDDDPVTVIGVVGDVKNYGLLRSRRRKCTRRTR